jgi:hypothetical protein
LDLRVKFREGEHRDILALLVGEIRRLGYPLFETFVSRSPAIEALYTNPDERAFAILHRARKTLIHRQMHHLAQDVLAALDEVTARVSAVEPELADRSVDVPLAPPPAPRPAVAPEVAVRPREVPLEPAAAPQPAAEAPRDRRNQVRRIYGAEVAAFRRMDPPVLPLRALDLSPEGLGIEPAEQLTPGERVHIALPQPQGEPPLLLWARVVRSGATGAQGLVFESDAPLVRSRLEQLTEQLRQAAPG